MIQTVYIGDTVTVEAKFYNLNNALIDADNNQVTFTAFSNDSLEVVASALATRSSAGVYKYDWIIPEDADLFVVEMKGFFDSLPQLNRIKVRSRFRP